MRKRASCSHTPTGLINDPTSPEPYLAMGWVRERLYSVIFEFREDEEGEVVHLVTLWKSTKEEIRLYEENS